MAKALYCIALLQLLRVNDGFRSQTLLRSGRRSGNPSPARAPRRSSLEAHRIGVYYGTVGQNTESVAEGIVEMINAANPDEPDIAGTEPMYIDEVESVKEFEKYDALILGCPTWNTGADEERSGTAWDDLYYGDMQGVSLAGKKVAVFGCGDSIGYGENFCDAIDGESCGRERERDGALTGAQWTHFLYHHICAVVKLGLLLSSPTLSLFKSLSYATPNQNQ